MYLKEEEELESMLNFKDELGRDFEDGLLGSTVYVKVKQQDHYGIKTF